MAKTLQKGHWLVHVLRRAGIQGADQLAIDPGMPSAEAWMGACEATGLSQDALADHVAAYFRLKVAVPDAAEPAAAKLVPEKVARQHGIFPLRENDRYVTVATSDPTNFAAEQAVGFISGRKAVFEIAPPPVILESINASYRGDGPIESLPTRVDGGVDDSGATLKQREAKGAEARDVETKETGAADLPILIVDDDPEDRLLVRTLLQKQGYEVEEANDGDEALERVGAGDSHAMVVLDLEMPTLGGREVLAALRSSPDTMAMPVIVLTGSPDPEDEYRLMDEGADDYLRKPLDAPRFVARVKATLRRARMP